MAVAKEEGVPARVRNKSTNPHSILTMSSDLTTQTVVNSATPAKPAVAAAPSAAQAVPAARPQRQGKKQKFAPPAANLQAAAKL